VCLGTDFITDVLLVSLQVSGQVLLSPGKLATHIAMRTVCEALAKAASIVLELETNEVQAEYRVAMTDAGRDGLEAELYLYDTLPGGAGFSRRVGELGEEVFRTALKIVEGCDCDYSCYKCLRSYKNKLDHNLLDRHIGADLLRHVLVGSTPIPLKRREGAALALLANDLERQAGDSIQVAFNAHRNLDGVGQVVLPLTVCTSDGRERRIAITHPLTPDASPDASINTAAEFGAVPVVYVSELRARRQLPLVTADILGSLGLA